MEAVRGRFHFYGINYKGCVIQVVLLRNKWVEQLLVYFYNTAVENNFLIITRNSTTIYITGCNSDIWKKVQANILKNPLVLLKQTMPQQKALDLSFNLAPWKWVWHYQEAVTPSCTKRSQKPSAPTYAFHGKEAWRPPDNATPTFRVPN